MRMIMNDPEQSVLNFLSLSEFFDKDLFAFFSSLSFRFHLFCYLTSENNKISLKETFKLDPGKI